ncbi:MAG: thiamine phosphate synthase [Acidobacteriota bacterium]|nr:thiamine phosphate synthase [Acidobacteriota bacterium]
MAQATGSSSLVRSLADSRLYLITAARPDLEEFLGAAVRGGVDIVQIRDSQLPDRALLEALAVARKVTARHRVPLVVNDRPDLALLAGADLVHVGQDDLSVQDARRIASAVGLSTHTPTQIDDAEADYLGVGPVFATATKPGVSPVGLELIRYAALHARQPWYAIGGITAANAAEVVGAGAERLAVVGAIGDAADPERAARALHALLP